MAIFGHLNSRCCRYKVSYVLDDLIAGMTIGMYDKTAPLHCIITND